MNNKLLLTNNLVDLKASRNLHSEISLLYLHWITILLGAISKQWNIYVNFIRRKYNYISSYFVYNSKHRFYNIYWSSVIHWLTNKFLQFKNIIKKYKANRRTRFQFPLLKMPSFFFFFFFFSYRKRKGRGRRRAREVLEIPFTPVDGVTTPRSQ